MKKSFPEISRTAFQHPTDLAALKAVEKIPGIDWLVRKILRTLGEKKLRLFYTASGVKVSEKQLPHIHSLLVEACEILDIQEIPELFLCQDQTLNATTIGVDKPFIVLNSGIVDVLTDEELQCVLGHELGHIVCGHALYSTILMLMIRVWHLFLGIPGGVYALVAVRTALLEWSRKAELSCDRAGLLVCQDLNISLRLCQKLAGGKLADQINQEEMLAQAEEYLSGGDLLDGVHKLSFLLNNSHPFPVLRIREISKWGKSKEYQEILNGNYSKRTDAKQSGLLEEVKKSMNGYQESIKDQADPFLNTVKDISGGAVALGEDLLSYLGGKKKKVDKTSKTEK